MRQMTIFDYDTSNRYHGKPDYDDNRDEIIRISIENRFTDAIPLAKCCIEPVGMFLSCTAFFVRCPVCKMQTKYHRHLYEAKQAWNRGERA